MRLFILKQVISTLLLMMGFAQDQQVTKSLTVQVSSVTVPPPTNGFDGPAELPRVFIKSTTADQLSPGNKILVPAGASLSAAYTAAKCGDTLLLAHLADFPVTDFVAKGCDDAHTVTIRTDISDLLLPLEGKRINPCYAGVASLPGRPAFSCPTITRVMPRIIYMGQQTIHASLDHARFIGINFHKIPGSGLTTALVMMAGSIRVTFDRCWFEGGPLDENTRGIDGDGARSLSVRDSYFTDFHCKSPGTCSDSQAIMAGITNTPDGPYQILNNHLEASAEVILFGGGIGTGVPVDIEIRFNHLFKPMTWNPSDPSYAGIMFSVKNIIELKNGQRALIEGNYLENNWGGFSQVGYAFTLTPKNAHARVSDVTFRFNWIKNTSGIAQIANILQSTTLIASDEGARYSIHNIVAENLGYPTCYKCGPSLFQVNDVAALAMDGLSINHITAIPAPAWRGDLMFLGGAPITRAKITNSIIDAGYYGVWAIGSSPDCAANMLSPLAKLDSCFVAPYSFAGNVIPRGGKQCATATPPMPDCIQQAATWPLGNFFPTNMSTVGFVNLAGGDYHLASTSLYKGKAIDGKDPGADIDRVLSMTAGVR